MNELLKGSQVIHLFNTINIKLSQSKIFFLAKKISVVSHSAFVEYSILDHALHIQKNVCEKFACS